MNETAPGGSLPGAAWCNHGQMSLPTIGARLNQFAQTREADHLIGGDFHVNPMPQKPTFHALPTKHRPRANLPKIIISEHDNGFVVSFRKLGQGVRIHVVVECPHRLAIIILIIEALTFPGFGYFLASDDRLAGVPHGNGGRGAGMGQHGGLGFVFVPGAPHGREATIIGANSHFQGLGVPFPYLHPIDEPIVVLVIATGGTTTQEQANHCANEPTSLHCKGPHPQFHAWAHPFHVVPNASASCYSPTPG